MNRLRFFCTALIILLLGGCAPADGTKAMKNIDQNIDTYTNQAELEISNITPQNQKLLKSNYLKKYYSAWDEPLIHTEVEQIKGVEKEKIKNFLVEPGVREHDQPIQLDWVKHIADKMDLSAFPSINQKAITIRNTNIRALPTNKPSYRSSNLVGEGYPFDYLQNSLIQANLPIHVIHQSKDKSWSFIISHFDSGWVKTRHLAFVDEKFIQDWKTNSYVTPTKLDFCLHDKENNDFLFKARLGTILPLVKENTDSYEVKVAVANKNSTFASISTAVANKNDAEIWPVFPSTKNFVRISQVLIGEPYGWGGLFGYRDCSSTIMDIYATFGIWFPRNTVDQATAGEQISFNGLKTEEKIKLIEENATPFLTIINIKGHVLLYIGKKDNEHYVIQDVWGLHTGTKLKETGRSIIAKTIITPITFGKNYINVPRSDIERAHSMTRTFGVGRSNCEND